MSIRASSPLSKSYEDTYFISPFLKYHERMCSHLPVRGKTCEVTLRIAMVAAYVFIALPLGALAFIEWSARKICQQKIPTLFSITNGTQRIANRLPSEMVDALGGADAVNQLSIIKDWDGILDPSKIPAPIVIGFRNELPFLIFCYQRRDINGIWRSEADYLERTNNNSWMVPYGHESELGMRMYNLEVTDNSPAAKYMLDKISRLTYCDTVGILKRYSVNGQEMLTQVPKMKFDKARNQEAYRPQDAFLRNDKLDEYLTIDTIFYERNPGLDATDIFLWNPNTANDDEERLRRYFPNLGSK